VRKKLWLKKSEEKLEESPIKELNIRENMERKTRKNQRNRGFLFN
jgi:hypothetical protein